MAIAPSKLGQLVETEWHSEEALILKLRTHGLVKKDASDADLKSTFQRARDEHAALPSGQRSFNSMNERVRVFLKPFLSAKGKEWAEPLESLKLPD